VGVNATECEGTEAYTHNNNKNNDGDDFTISTFDRLITQRARVHTNTHARR